MDDRELLRWYGVGRLAVGAALFVAPVPLLRPWLGDDVGRPAAVALARLFAGRDLALAAGVVTAARDGRDMRRWAAAAATADACDAVISLAAGRRRRPALTLAVGGSALAGALLGGRLARRL